MPTSAFPRIRVELSRIGINAYTLFPDLDGLCESIAYKYSKLKDEQEDKFLYKTPLGKDDVEL